MISKFEIHFHKTASGKWTKYLTPKCLTVKPIKYANSLYNDPKPKIYRWLWFYWNNGYWD